MRNKMVNLQIEGRGINDRKVLSAMRKVERHRFVPDKLKQYSYNDYPLSIGENQTISQPYVVALMTELMELKGEEKVLEIGTGSGYQAAILGEIVKEVYTIEIISKLGETAKKVLEKLRYNNVKVRIGDGYKGWPEKAPFDAIIVTCAPDHIPKPLVDQLKIGGKIVIPVGDFYQQLVIIKKNRDGLSKTTNIPVRFVPMTGKALERDK